MSNRSLSESLCKAEQAANLHCKLPSRSTDIHSSSRLATPDELPHWYLTPRRPASMASPSSSTPADDIFSKLQAADPRELERRQEALNERLNTAHLQNQERLAELIDANSTLPTTISSVTVLGAPNTRHGFLKRVVEPLLSANRNKPYTQAEVVQEAAKTGQTLRDFGKLHCVVMA